MNRDTMSDFGLVCAAILDDTFLDLASMLKDYRQFRVTKG